MPKNTMKLADIRVPERFLEHPPKPEKVEDRKGWFSGPDGKPYVRVNAAGWLTDCYATYLAAQALGLESVRVKPGRDDCLVATAAYSGGGKEYAWEVPPRVEQAWSERGVAAAAGLPLAVRDREGRVRCVRATGFRRAPWPTGHGEIIGLWSRSGGRRRGKEGGEDA